ncbi:MAG: AEC family transporter [Candidatus Omnitrophica bacterium]|nr:AEC family transporter [Candidatus Omnitrophota bacterium]MDD5081253.1 AEC family transporter [Candidatus Omnitrophota bacterium]MDD5441555.1 AEC family transporter [Candidatus Omnitrophota bacterium]
MFVVSIAILKLTLIVFAGYFLCKFKYPDDKTLNFLSDFVVSITMPALVFSTLVTNVDIVLANSPLLFILLSILFFAGGLLTAMLITFRMEHVCKREFFGLVTFQNAGYLPMVLVSLLFPAGLSDKFLVYIFLYILGYNILMWSLGSFFLFKKRKDKFKLKTLVNPPVIAVLLGLVTIYSGLYKYLPAVIVEPVQMIGKTTFVLSMIVLGGWLSRVTLKDIMSDFPLSFGAALVKLIIIPLAFLVCLILFKIDQILGLFVIIQAAMPSAVSLPIVANIHGANSRFMAHAVLLSHIFSILTVSFWISLYMKFSGILF